MTTASLRDLLHRATHRVPGVPAHVDQPAGHQGTTTRRPPHHQPPSQHAHHRLQPSAQQRHQHHQSSSQQGRNHSSARPPRFLPGWQRRVAALFGRDL